MKILHINIADTEGGAARAAYRLFRQQCDVGLDATMLVSQKFSDDIRVQKPGGFAATAQVRAAAHCDRLPLRFAPHVPEGYWSLGWFPSGIQSAMERIKPDLVHLHWIGNGFMPVSLLKHISCPIVWTLHDSWAFTGGCHLPGDCVRFRDKCGACPQLGSVNEVDVSRWTWWRKKTAWKNLPFTIASPSRWLAEKAVSSSLIADRRVELIPNGIDTSVYQVFDMQMARSALGINPDKYVVLIGTLKLADNRQKGFREALIALAALSPDIKSKTELALFGVSQGLTTTQHGVLKDDISLALLYSAADLFLMPSHSENLSNTIMESMSCGTPVVAFDVGGNSDMINHGNNGYLAAPGDCDDLARGMRWMLSDKDRLLALSSQARKKIVSEFEIGITSAYYENLYTELIAKEKF
jgi:glycosyltransferase involved in cell wall biosynthesis